jgi:hypothetical protein
MKLLAGKGRIGEKKWQTLMTSKLNLLAVALERISLRLQCLSLDLHKLVAK